MAEERHNYTTIYGPFELAPVKKGSRKLSDDGSIKYFLQSCGCGAARILKLDTRLLTVEEVLREQDKNI